MKHKNQEVFNTTTAALDVLECEQMQQNESVCLEDTLRHLTNYSETNALKQRHYSASAPLSFPSLHPRLGSQRETHCCGDF